MRAKRKPQDDIAFLADRLALALAYHQTFIKGVLLLPSREADRQEMREEPEYQLMLASVREILKRERKRWKTDQS